MDQEGINSSRIFVTFSNLLIRYLTTVSFVTTVSSSTRDCRFLFIFTFSWIKHVEPIWISWIISIICTLNIPHIFVLLNSSQVHKNPQSDLMLGIDRHLPKKQSEMNFSKISVQEDWKKKNYVAGIFSSAESLRARIIATRILEITTLHSLVKRKILGGENTSRTIVRNGDTVEKKCVSQRLSRDKSKTLALSSSRGAFARALNRLYERSRREAASAQSRCLISRISRI